MHFLQLVLQVLWHLAAPATMTCVATPACALCDCFGWISEAKVVPIIPRLIKFVNGNPSAKWEEHRHDYIGDGDQSDPGKDQGDRQVPVWVEREHGIPVEFQDPQNSIRTLSVNPTTLSCWEKDQLQQVGYEEWVAHCHDCIIRSLVVPTDALVEVRGVTLVLGHTVAHLAAMLLMCLLLSQASETHLV